MGDANISLRALRAVSGISRASLRFASGKMTVFAPARRVANTLSRMPPIGNTLPRRVISPVIATLRTGRLVNTDASTVAVINFCV